MTDTPAPELSAAQVAHLLPCPFCGSDPKLVAYNGRYDVDDFCVHCDSCDLALNGDSTPEAAAARWNHRATRPPAPADALMEALRIDALDNDDPRLVNVARAIAENGFGRPWDDLLPTNASDTDQGDLIEYARAAINALTAHTASSAGAAGKLRITIEDREDGGVRIYSDDMPGLILDGADRESVGACIIPAIDALRKMHAAFPAAPADQGSAG